MKNSFLFLTVFLFCGIVAAQNFEGSWKLMLENGEPIANQEVIRINQDGYFAYGSKEIDNNNFLSAAGGKFQLNGSDYSIVQDFNTKDPNSIGKELKYTLKWEGDDKVIISNDTHTEVWKRVSEKKDGLTQNWVITGRERNGEMTTMTPGNRRTVKILGGGRFQWIAFNSASKEFSGTGGGTYTAEDGKYIETIEFFSRDNRRVGAKLEFDYETKDGKWHHKGESSKGDPIYEIWSPYSEAYTK